VLRVFFALKNPTASAGFEPANLGTEAAIEAVDVRNTMMQRIKNKMVQWYAWRKNNSVYSFRESQIKHPCDC
jgi:hypothetical protein